MLIINACIITGDPGNPLIENGAVAIEGKNIAAVGAEHELKEAYPELPVEDAGGAVLMPGLINAHAHLYSALARGMPPPDRRPKNFIETLKEKWWKLDSALTADDIYISAVVGLMESASCGVTTVFDHHSSPNAISRSLSYVADAVDEVGLRASLSYEVSDRYGEESVEKAIWENANFITTAQKNYNDITGIFGLHASFTLSDETLRACVEVNGEKGFHVHVAEDAADLEDAKSKYGKSVVARLAELGILNGNSIAAHCVHVDKRDILTLRDTGAFIVHNPRSNFINNVGTAPAPAMIGEGAIVGLGTDSYTWDVNEEASYALLTHTGKNGAGLSVDQLIGMLRANAEFATRVFGVTLGRIEKDAVADIVIVDYLPPTPLSKENISTHWIFGIAGLRAKTVLVSGRAVIENGNFTFIDREAVYARARKTANALWGRI